MADKKLIKSLSLAEADEWFRAKNEKPYRGKQLFNWLFEKNAASFSEMTDFSKELRQMLDENFILSPLAMEERLVSDTDGTEKYLFRTLDDQYIEAVLIKNGGDPNDRLTVCVSCQAGCPMNCSFCSTGKIGFKRNLEAGEIIEQLCQVRRISGLKNNNIVFMGMGEPFLNYDSVMKAADIMNYSFGFHISVRRITVSTCGILTGIERFIDEKRPYNLAISLNDTEPEKRRRNMPVEISNPFAEVRKLLERKFPVSRNRLTIEYVMRKDNISAEDAKRLKKMFRYTRIKLNLIPLNSSDKNEVPSKSDMEGFIKDLEIMNVPVSVRESGGADINGACGQLAGKIG